MEFSPGLENTTRDYLRFLRNLVLHKSRTMNHQIDAFFVSFWGFPSFPGPTYSFRIYRFKWSSSRCFFGGSSPILVISPTFMILDVNSSYPWHVNSPCLKCHSTLSRCGSLSQKNWIFRCMSPCFAGASLAFGFQGSLVTLERLRSR